MIKANLLATLAFGYGRIGHMLSGMIAQELLSPLGLSFVNQTLPPEYKGRLETATVWGDEIKSDHSYDWAKGLHYINPINDFPPRQCSYRPGNDQDCPNGNCVVAAVRNYTLRLLEKDIIQTSDRQESLLFLIHFIGDIHQPLHATGRQRGGNQALAKFQGQLTNMHAIWDYKMFEKRIREDFKGDSNLYVRYLLKQMATAWRAEVPEWLSCPKKDEPEFQRQLCIQSEMDGYFGSCLLTPSPQTISDLVCPEKWASFANKVNCDSVWPKYKRKYELSGEYYKENVLVEEKMLAQAGLRMAAIIDYIAESGHL